MSRALLSLLPTALSQYSSAPWNVHDVHDSHHWCKVTWVPDHNAWQCHFCSVCFCDLPLFSTMLKLMVGSWKVLEFLCQAWVRIMNYRKCTGVQNGPFWVLDVTSWRLKILYVHFCSCFVMSLKWPAHWTYKQVLSLYSRAEPRTTGASNLVSKRKLWNELPTCFHLEYYAQHSCHECVFPVLFSYCPFCILVPVDIFARFWNGTAK